MPENTVTLILRYAMPGDTFDPSIEGVEPISTEGTPVPADQVLAVKKAAGFVGVSLGTKRTRRK